MFWNRRIARLSSNFLLYSIIFILHNYQQMFCVLRGGTEHKVSLYADDILLLLFQIWMLLCLQLPLKSNTDAFFGWINLCLILYLPGSLHVQQLHSPNHPLVPPYRSIGSPHRMPPTSSPCTPPPSTGWRTWSAWETLTKPASSATC